MSMCRRLGNIVVLSLCLLASVGQALANPFTFSDNFNSGASPLWSDATGDWTASGGNYYAQVPNNAPLAITTLPFALQNSGLTVTTTVNNIGDDGIVFVGPDNQGYIVLLGGQGYGQGYRGGGAGGAIYFWPSVTPQGQILGLVESAFTPGSSYTISITVDGGLFSAYYDPATSLDSSSVLLASYLLTPLSSIRVGLYDDQPNTVTGSGFGPPSSFSNFSVSGQLVPEPSATALFIGAVLLIARIAGRCNAIFFGVAGGSS